MGYEDVERGTDRDTAAPTFCPIASADIRESILAILPNLIPWMGIFGVMNPSQNDSLRASF